MSQELHDMAMSATGSTMDKKARQRYFVAILTLLPLLREEGCTPEELELLTLPECATLRTMVITNVRSRIKNASTHVQGMLSLGA